MATKPTISDVAARAGVSKGAVSFALNGRPGVSADTRVRILEVAAELGFLPSAPARALSTSRSGALGLVLARSPETLRSDPFFSPFIAGMESSIAPVGHALMLRFVADEGTEARAYGELAAAGRVDAVVLTDLRVRDPRPALLSRIGLPAVTLNRPRVPSSAPAVCVDDRPAVRDAVEHLIGLGHRRIGHVGGPRRYLHAANRRRTFSAVLRAHGLPPGPVVETDFTAGSGAHATRELLDAPDRPTAVLYDNDTMAVAGLAAAQQRGLVVPRDLSIVGFDDAELSAHLHPALTTVRTDAFGWGRAAAAALLGLLAGEQMQDIHLPAAQFVVRESTGPAPTALPSRRRRPVARLPAHPNHLDPALSVVTPIHPLPQEAIS